MDWMQVQTIVFFVALGGLWVYSLLNGKNLKSYIELARKLLDALGVAIQAIGEKFPGQSMDVMRMIIEIAKTAAAYAEQLFKIGSIGKEARKQAAIEYATAALTEAGVEQTDTIRKIIDGAVEAACLLDIPHGTVPNAEA